MRSATTRVIPLTKPGRKDRPPIQAKDRLLKEPATSWPVKAGIKDAQAVKGTRLTGWLFVAFVTSVPLLLMVFALYNRDYEVALLASCAALALGLFTSGAVLLLRHG